MSKVIATTTRTKERPILFSGPMVQAILEGRKTQTRRIVTRLSGIGSVSEFAKSDTPGWDYTFRDKRMRWNDLDFNQLLSRCPYGSVGERLWVRETWADYFDGNTDVSLRIGNDWQNRMRYRVCCDRPWGDRWRPSIYMPRWASRITLEITGLRVECLQDITEDDAKSEGIATSSNGVYFMDYTHGIANVCKPEFSFMTLWQSINGPESWSANPWVWVVEFRNAQN